MFRPREAYRLLDKTSGWAVFKTEQKSGMNTEPNIIWYKFNTKIYNLYYKSKKQGMNVKARKTKKQKYKASSVCMVITQFN